MAAAGRDDKGATARVGKSLRWLLLLGRRGTSGRDRPYEG